MRAFSTLLIGSAILACMGTAYTQTIDWEKVDAALGRKAAVTGDVHRYGFPRSDLTVTVDGVTVKPAFALRLGPHPHVDLQASNKSGETKKCCYGGRSDRKKSQEPKKLRGGMPY